MKVVKNAEHIYENGLFEIKITKNGSEEKVEYLSLLGNETNWIEFELVDLLNLRNFIHEVLIAEGIKEEIIRN